METRPLGRTGIDVSLLTFGCGQMGGLMTRGESNDQDRAVAWARDHGVNHFDTAPSYGNGTSEINLGRALGRDRDGIIVSTKVRLAEADLARPADAIRASLEGSLRRLRRDQVDLLQLHNHLDDGSGVTDSLVLDDVVPAFETLRGEGKIRFLGFTALGDTDALHRLIESGCFDSAQIFYSMLAPSAGDAMPAGYPAHDYRRIIDVAARHGVGSIGVRILAAGALSGSAARHPLSSQTVRPFGSGPDFATDVSNALRFSPLVAAGYAASLPELAVRYVISNRGLSTAEIGIATLEELQQAVAAVNAGPLPAPALAEIGKIQTDLAAGAG
jgi:L-galactose dehydrogenase/L-glyceraldehyde 3-phosphate reductase